MYLLPVYLMRFSTSIFKSFGRTSTALKAHSLLTHSLNSLSNVHEMREGAVDVSLNLVSHLVRRFQVLSEVLQPVPIEGEKLWPHFQAHLVRLKVSHHIIRARIIYRNTRAKTKGGVIHQAKRVTRRWCGVGGGGVRGSQRK